MRVERFTKINEKRYEFVVDGEVHNLWSFLRITHIGPKPVQRAIACDNPVAELNKLLADREKRKRLKVGTCAKIYVNPDGEEFTVKKLAQYGVKGAVAYRLLLMWERGEITTDELILGDGQATGGNDKWKSMGSNPRSNKIAKIPGGGTWERRLPEPGPISGVICSREVASVRGRTGALVPYYMGD